MVPTDGSERRAGYADLSKRIDRLEQAIERLLEKIDQLGFVRRDVYEADRRTEHVEHQAIRDDLVSVRAIAMWALGVVVTVAIAGIITGVIVGSGR